MHIAFLTPEFPLKNYSHSGGLGTSIQNLSFSLAQKSVKVSVFLYGQNKHEIFIENGVTFHILPFIKRKYFNWYFQKKDIEKYINKIIIQEKIDVLEAPDWTGITSFMRFKIPIMIRFHGSDTYFCKLENRKQKFKNYFLEKMAVLGATAFIAPTQFARDFTAELFRINQKKVTIIPYGLQLSKFHNANPTQFDANTILYIGTIIRKKGVFEIPEIFRKVLQTVPNAKLILIGTDSGDKITNSKSTWKMVDSSFTEKERLQVSYLGKLQYSEVQNKIQKANVCIFPSFAETLGMVTIESMAMQKAVVNTNIGWANELLEDEISGYLVNPKNHELFAERIIFLLQNKENAVEMGKNARIFVENHFDMEQIVIRNIEFYKRFVS
jgi:glycosyltransferase involved in cell wall biosynthesis